MAIKPIPRLILIVAAVAAIGFGINTWSNMRAKTAAGVPSAVPQAIDVPVASTTAPQGSQTVSANIGTATLPAAKGDYTAKVLVLPWNATASLHLANGDVTTSADSLMAQRGVRLTLEMQDDYSKMVAEQALFAAEVSAGSNKPTKGAAFVVIMGDALPGYAGVQRHRRMFLGSGWACGIMHHHGSCGGTLDDRTIRLLDVFRHDTSRSNDAVIPRDDRTM